MLKKPIIKEVNEFKRENSSISVIESLKDYDFICKRLYVINTDTECSRGNHGHKELKQIFNCPTGESEIIIIGLDYKEKFILNHKNKVLYLPSGYWREIKMKKGTSLVVMASEEYDENDYIRNFKDYISWVSTKK